MVGLLTLTGCSEANSPTATRRPPAIERANPTTEPQLRWLNDLRSQRNKEIPVALIRGVATDMANSKDYPSIAASGNLLIDQYDNPKKVLDMLPFPGTKSLPMRIQFSDKLGDRTRAMMEVGGDDIAVPITLIGKSNGQVLNFMGAKKNSTTLDIFLHSYLIDINASSWSYKLLLAKEASHLFYLQQQMDDVWKQVAQKYDIPEDNDARSNLLVTAHYVGDPRLRIPKLGSHFNRVEELLDYAGYWHINNDIIRLDREGKLTPEDRFVLEANIAMANLSIAKGLAVVKSNGNIEWREGIGPFSDEWIAVADQALRIN